MGYPKFWEKMKIGDKVRFLNQTGGGIVVGFGRKGWVTVQDEDGFDIPMPEKECVVIEQNVVAKEEVNIQTKDGEKLNIAIIYVKNGNGFSCIMANECNYALLATYTNIIKEDEGTPGKASNSFTTTFAGEVLPYERKKLFDFGKSELNTWSKRVLLRIIPFKRSQPFKQPLQHALKPIIEQDFILDPVNLLKESMFRRNEYIQENGYVVPVINENMEEIPMVGKLEEQQIKMALKEKFEGERALSFPQQTHKKAASAQNRAYVNGKWIDLPSGGLQKEWLQENALIRINSQGYMEVDLHAEALLDTTIGMDNTAILKYQLEKFNEAMAAVLHKRGSKIVFIHGKGDGVLRNALIKELKTKYSQSKWQDASFKEYGYGATLVTV